MVGNPHPVDVHVGHRLRQARKHAGLSQTALGRALGITFQQIQKYENGSNRLGASRLWHAADSLDVDVGFFFEGLPDNILADIPGAAGPARLGDVDGPNDDVRAELPELIDCYYDRPRPVRDAIKALVKAIARSDI